MPDSSLFRRSAKHAFYFLVKLLLPLVPLLARFPLAWRVRELLLRGPDVASWLRRYGPDWDAAEEEAPPGVPLTVLLFDAKGIKHDAVPETGYVLVMTAACRPHSRMPERIGQCLRNAPDTDLLYTDEWRLEGERIASVYCKPAWDPLYFQSTGYTGEAFAVAAALLRRVVREAEEEGILFRDPVHLFSLCQKHARGNITHLPVPLFGIAEEKAGRSMPDALLHPEAAAPITPVSLIIPFRDRPDLLRPCLNSLRAVTDYAAWECVLVDNGSTDSAVTTFCRSLAREDSRFTILERDEPFNFSHLVNQGAAQATGDILVLLNSDMEARDPSWLQALVRFAAQKDVGCVGAKLLYPNGLVQHGGIVGGMRSPFTGEPCFGHAHLGSPGNAPGYFRQLAVPRTVLAVTGAALAVRKTVFDSLGGFDENLAVAFNDVDFCLRAAAQGLRTVWTPEAILLHHESATRGLDMASPEKSARLAQEFDFLLKRWGNVILDDPWYNPNCCAEKMYALAEPPRARTARSLPARAGSVCVRVQQEESLCCPA